MISKGSRGGKEPNLTFRFLQLFLCFPACVQASFMTYTSLDDWISAVGGNYQEETFNTFTTDVSFNNGASVSLDDFILKGFGDARSNVPSSGTRWNRIDASPWLWNQRPSVDGSTQLAVRVCEGQSLNCHEGFDIAYFTSLLAWGAYFGETGSSFEVIAGGSLVGRADNNGFFGFVSSDAPFSAIRISTCSQCNGAVTNMDNFVYVPATGAAPSEVTTSSPTMTEKIGGPSRAPTWPPTISPTLWPTATPIESPSSVPVTTSEPSRLPIVQPSESPILQNETPSTLPISIASDGPSHVHTLRSSIPSDVPSLVPSGAPVIDDMPNSLQSSIPSDAPSLIPSGVPTTAQQVTSTLPPAGTVQETADPLAVLPTTIPSVESLAPSVPSQTNNNALESNQNESSSPIVSVCLRGCIVLLLLLSAMLL